MSLNCEKKLLASKESNGRCIPMNKDECKISNKHWVEEYNACIAYKDLPKFQFKKMTWKPTDQLKSIGINSFKELVKSYTEPKETSFISNIFSTKTQNSPTLIGGKKKNVKKKNTPKKKVTKKKVTKKNTPKKKVTKKNTPKKN
jgi:hypothetical protein